MQAHATKMASLLRSTVSDNSSVINRSIPVLARAALHVQASTYRQLHVAAAAGRGVVGAKQSPSRSQFHKPATAAGQSAVATQASALVMPASSSSYSPSTSEISKLAYAYNTTLFERWGLLEQSRRNPRHKGHVDLLNSLKQAVPHFYAALELSSWKHNPMYLGHIEALCDKADRSICQGQHGEMSTAAVRKWLIDNPDVLFAATGLTVDDLESSRYHIDHVIPRTKSGANHPGNYIIVPAHLNLRWGGWISLEKWLVVGPATVAAVIAFHATRLPSASQDDQSMLLQTIPVYLQ